MRVFRNSIGKWCRFVYEDKEKEGIVFDGGQDKDPYEWGYRTADIHVPGEDGLFTIDWPDVKALGPQVKAPRF